MIHGRQDLLAMIALVHSAKDNDKDGGVGAQHRRIVRELARGFRYDARAGILVPFCAKLRVL